MKTAYEKKVLLIDTTANFSGGLVYVIEILPRLISYLHGWRIVVYGPRPKNCPIEADHPDVKWITTNPGVFNSGFVARGILKFLWRQLVLPFHAFNEKADVVFSTANFSSFFFDLTSTPVVIALHNLVPFHCPGWYKESTLGLRCRTVFLRMVTVGACHSKATFVIFSKYARVLLRMSGVAPARTRLAYHGAPEWEERWTGANSLRVLLVSNYFRYKRMETVVEAWRKALPNLPTGAKLLIQGVVGDETYFDTLKRQIATLNLADSIELGRGVPAEQLKELYRTSRFMVFPPIGENCPITLLEAMRIGIPIIGTKADPVPEICGAAALYFEDRDSDACALNITNLFNIPELAAEMSDLGQERSRDFSWDVSAQRTAEHILQVCESSYEHHSDEALARKSVAKNIP